jgi:molybdopterin converting factor small subunit
VRVTVRLGEPLWRAVGERSVALDLPRSEATIAEVIAVLEAAYPRFRAEWGPHTVEAGDDPILGRFVVFVDDQLVQASELPALRVRDGAALMLVSPMAGGAV